MGLPVGLLTQLTLKVHNKSLHIVSADVYYYEHLREFRMCIIMCILVNQRSLTCG